MELNEIEIHAQKILKGLVEFHLEQGYQNDSYNDPETGGIYEHKLAARLGYELIKPSDFPPQDFMAAIQILEAKGFIKRNKRKDDYPIMGVRPTTQGVLEYQKMMEKITDESKSMSSIDPTRVFVVHGRNEELRKSMFDFLRSIGLKPIEWTQAIQMTGNTSPFIGDILDAAFQQAQAVVVLLNGDDEARLRAEYHSDKIPDYEKNLTPQARPNVIFEAGLALGRFPKRTIIVEVGDLRPFSDIAGRHIIRMEDTVKKRQNLAQRLLIAGCSVDLSGTDWHDSGSFSVTMNDQTTKRVNPANQHVKQISENDFNLSKSQIDIMMYLADNDSGSWEEIRAGTNIKAGVFDYQLMDLIDKKLIEDTDDGEKPKIYLLSILGVQYLSLVGKI